MDSDRDLSNFPPEFTDEPVHLTPDDPYVYKINIINFQVMGILNTQYAIIYSNFIFGFPPSASIIYMAITQLTSYNRKNFCK